MTDGPSFRIGDARSYVSVTVTRRESSDAVDTSDGNWVVATVSLQAGAFAGAYEAALRTEDFLSFRRSLAEVHKTLAGKARFETCEGWLTLELVGDGKGHIAVACDATDLPGTGSTLSFRFEIDQTDVPGTLRGLEAIEAAYPVISSSS